MNKKQLIAAGTIIFLLLSGCSREGIKHDPIEDNPKYQERIKQAEEEAGHNTSYYKSRMGYCHLFWREKKRILKEKYGIDWKTPAELNPYVYFD